MNAPVDVLVLGGGIAGMSTAYELQKQGRTFRLLEARARLGGVIYSEERDGFTLDGGPDSLLIQKRDGIALCEELGLGPRLVTTKLPRQSFIQRNGRLYALPAASVLGIPTEWGPFIRSGLFSPLGKLRMGMELFVPKRTEQGDESIGSFMRRRFGSEATTYLAEPLLAGIHAGDVDQLSVRAVFPRFPETEARVGSLLRAFRSGPRHSSPDGAFKSLPGGLSELVHALERALHTEAIHRDTRAASIRREGDAWVVVTDKGDVHRGRALVVATPAYATAPLLTEAAPQVARLCGEVPYASAATVALAFRRDAVAHRLDGSGFVVPRAERSGIMAASWLSSKWPNRAPEGFVLMRAFLGGARDPEALAKNDAEMVATALTALRPLLGISGDPLFTRIFRWDRSNAQHNVGHLDRIAAIERSLQSHPGLFVTGSGFRGTGIPDCVADGRATARHAHTWLTTTASSAPSASVSSSAAR